MIRLNRSTIDINNLHMVKGLGIIKQKNFKKNAFVIRSKMLQLV